MKPVGYVLGTLVLITLITALTLSMGVNGFLIGMLIAGVCLSGLYLSYRRRVSRLADALAPDETLIARGLVSESKYDERPAILIETPAGDYRVVIADSRGSLTIISTQMSSRKKPNPYDLKEYLEFSTSAGQIHFAPAEGFSIAGQADYAREVLNRIQPDGVAARIAPQLSE